MSSETFDVIIIGGGAAGLMCAIEAGARGRRVALLEHNARVGQKIAISGGGRCNFTNLGTTPENFLSANPDFCKSALARYTPWDFVALVEKRRVPYHEKKLGQQFCDGSSRAIIDLLLAECAEARVSVLTGCRVESVGKPERFRVATNLGEFESESLVIATGGLSFAKLGASDFGYRIARQFGLRITSLRPGLVPLTFMPEDRELAELSGLSLPVVARHRGQAFAENLLFTHRGVSGPAVLQISSYWREGEALHFDLPGRHDWPRRFAQAWDARSSDPEPSAWPMRFAGTEGYPKAEVTLGGVDTTQLSSKTMEARDVRGLFFIGEVVDVTGWLGGYNFQWAWASGHAAGQVA
ncbi:MAG: NAD(P)/FAD-dependent oxidoreductase [Chthoniobacteraceae bacterium]